MRILYCIPWLYNPGGMEKVLTTKVNYLADVLDYEITVVTTDQESKPVYFDLSPKVKLVHLQLDRSEQKLQAGFIKRKLYQAALRRRYRSLLNDYLQVHKQDFVISMVMGDEFWFLPDLKDGSQKIAELHFSTTYYNEIYQYKQLSGIKRWWRKRQQKQFFRRASDYKNFVVLTKKDLEIWQNNLDNLIQIYNPIDKVFSLRPNYKLNKAIAMGRLAPEKDFSTLIDIWHKIRPEFPEWQLSIYGAGQQEQELKSKIKELDLEGYVGIHTPVNNVAQLFNEHSLFLMTSISEGQGLALLEAQASGLPAIAFDCPNGPREIITNEENGYLIPLGDKSKYETALRQLLKNETQRVAMGQEAKKRAANFSLEPVMQQWVHIFERKIRND